MLNRLLKQIKQGLISNQSIVKLNDIYVYVGFSWLYGRGFHDVIRNGICTVALYIVQVVMILFSTYSDSLKYKS